MAEDWMTLAQEADEMSKRPPLTRQDAANSN
jgi:hypothetical protein